MRRPFLRSVLLVLAAGLLIPACRKGGGAPGAGPGNPKCVVKVFSTQQNSDFWEPWKTGSTVLAEGCGTILPGGRILTAAHLVDKATFIEVQKFGETQRFVAKVGPMALALDQALLTVEDPAFLKGAEPVEFGEMPRPGDKVLLQGGDELSAKEETLLGMDIVWSWEAATGVPALLTKDEIDKKINGCPVLRNGKFVGVPFTGWNKDKKVGLISPVSLVKQFLRAVDNGEPYPGLPDLGVKTQTLKSPSLREYHHLPPEKEGLLVTEVLDGGASQGVLKEGDVITQVGDQAVDNEGYTQMGKLGRVSIDYSISLHLPGEAVEVAFYREGKPQKASVTLKPEPVLVPFEPANRKPTYYLIAGFLFVPLTYNYLLKDWNSLKPEFKQLFQGGGPTPERRQVVVLSHVLPADINKGYHYFTNIILDKVNGKAVPDIQSLVEAFEQPVGGKHVLEFDDHAWTGSRVVFDAGKAAEATKEIMASLSIPSDRSDDLKKPVAPAPSASTPHPGDTR